MKPTELTLGKHKMPIHVLRTRFSAKVERMRQEAASVPLEDPDEQNLLEYFYPILFYCSEGDIPTQEEFLDMPLSQTNEWYEAVDNRSVGMCGSIRCIC